MLAMIAATAIQLAQEAIIMDSIYEMESSRGANCSARFEPGFLRRYGDKGNMPMLRKKFGDRDAASSWGPYQIMLCVAYENRFKGCPSELAQDDTNKAVAWTIVHKLCVKHRYDPYKVFKAYNGADSYAVKGMKLYNQWDN